MITTSNCKAISSAQLVISNDVGAVVRNHLGYWNGCIHTLDLRRVQMMTMREHKLNLEVYDLEMQVKNNNWLIHDLRDEIESLRAEVAKWQSKFCEAMAKREEIIAG